VLTLHAAMQLEKRSKRYRKNTYNTLLCHGNALLGQCAEMEFLDMNFTRLESFAPCCSQSLLLEDFTENHIQVLNLLTENPRNKKKHFVEKKECRRPGKNSSLRRHKFMPRNLD
jgi:hypothetical protein